MIATTQGRRVPVITTASYKPLPPEDAPPPGARRAVNTSSSSSQGPGQARGRLYDRVLTIQCRIPSRHPSPRAWYLVVFLLGQDDTRLTKDSRWPTRWGTDHLS